MNNNLAETFGNIDIYLFDQLLKGRYMNCKRVLDAGCGGGRNIIYFLKNGCEVFGADRNAEAIRGLRGLSQHLAPDNPVANFVITGVEDMPFDDAAFDLVICSAVLHFADDRAHFDSMLREIWRVLRPGGYLFARLASNIGIETAVTDMGNGRYLLPDGSVRFLADEAMLLNYTNELNGRLNEPIKTTNVSGLRCMTTWCVEKV